jgi:hypothetical protein
MYDYNVIVTLPATLDPTVLSSITRMLGPAAKAWYAVDAVLPRAVLSWTVLTSPALCWPLQSKHEQKGTNKPSRSNLTTLALLRLYWPQLLLHSFWVIVEIGIRCVCGCQLRD